MIEPSGHEQEARLRAAAKRLRVDAATVEIVRGFEGAGVESRLLKGPALATWYADDPARSYMDCDLWVRPGDLNAAAAALTRLGFSPCVYDQDLPEWWESHAQAWSRDTDGVVVDVHRKLQGLGVDGETAWEVLSGPAERLPVAGELVPALALPARVLYVTLHAAHHGRGAAKAVSHVERAVSVVDDATWRDAAALAERVAAVDAFAAGVRLVPAGAALAERIGLQPVQSVKVALEASSPPPVALGFEQLARAGGWWARIGIIVRKVVPPPSFIRRWWPAAEGNRRMLAFAYLYRPVWLAKKAPAGLRAWREARRQVRRGR
ncbi:MAG: hypothetical protein QOG68_2252 [Solirubrobacteraceae bacterium]|nr:hypothetical protein [Solirubrobacteraceae bacterium]